MLLKSALAYTREDRSPTLPLNYILKCYFTELSHNPGKIWVRAAQRALCAGTPAGCKGAAALGTYRCWACRCCARTQLCGHGLVPQFASEHHDALLALVWLQWRVGDVIMLKWVILTASSWVRRSHLLLSMHVYIHAWGPPVPGLAFWVVPQHKQQAIPHYNHQLLLQKARK